MSAHIRAMRLGYAFPDLLAELLGDDLAWVNDSALCAQVDSELFFPEKGAPSKDASTICERCPLLEPCAAYAVSHREPFGIWGATTARQRTRRAS